MAKQMDLTESPDPASGPASVQAQAAASPPSDRANQAAAQNPRDPPDTPVQREAYDLSRWTLHSGAVSLEMAALSLETPDAPIIQAMAHGPQRFLGRGMPVALDPRGPAASAFAGLVDDPPDSGAKWMYLDDKGKQRGPFVTSEIRDWFATGRFSASRMVAE